MVEKYAYQHVTTPPPRWSANVLHIKKKNSIDNTIQSLAQKIVKKRRLRAFHADEQANYLVQDMFLNSNICKGALLKLSTEYQQTKPPPDPRPPHIHASSIPNNMYCDSTTKYYMCFTELDIYQHVENERKKKEKKKKSDSDVCKEKEDQEEEGGETTAATVKAAASGRGKRRRGERGRGGEGSEAICRRGSVYVVV